MKPENLADSLRSIHDVRIEDDGEVVIVRAGEVMTKREFIVGSFTRDLFELMEKHLQEDDDQSYPVELPEKF